MLTGYEAVQICADLQSVLAHIAWVITSSLIAAVKAQSTNHQNVSQQSQVLVLASSQSNAYGTCHHKVQSTWRSGITTAK